MLLSELIVRQTPQGFSLVWIHLKCNLSLPRNQSNTAIKDNYPGENLKTKFKFKAASKKKKPTTNTVNVPLLFAIFIIIFHNMGTATYRPIYAGTLKSISNLTVKSRRKIILKTYLQAVFFFICHLKWMQVLFLMMDITAYYSDIHVLEHFNSAGIIFVLKRKIANSCRHFSPQKRLFLSTLWSKYTKNLCFQM